MQYVQAHLLSLVEKKDQKRTQGKFFENKTICVTCHIFTKLLHNAFANIRNLLTSIKMPSLLYSIKIQESFGSDLISYSKCKSSFQHSSSHLQQRELTHDSFWHYQILSKSNLDKLSLHEEKIYVILINVFEMFLKILHFNLLLWI